MNGEPTASTSSTNGEPKAATHGVGETLQLVLLQLREAGVELQRFAAVRWDRLRTAVRGVGFALVYGIVGGIVGATVLIAATIYLMAGLRGALTALFDGREWAGQLAVGGGVLILVWLGLSLARSRSNRNDMKKMVERYERLDEKHAERRREVLAHDGERVSRPAG